MPQVQSLRLVLNNQCNFKCFYCFNEGYPKKNRNHAQQVDNKHYLNVIDYLYNKHGLRKVKLTGGEPFLFSSINDLIKEIVLRFPDIKIGITTNGSQPERIKQLLLQDYSSKVKINVSLPSVDRNNFKIITGTDYLDKVFKSIEMLVSAGHQAMSIDTVLLLNTFADDSSAVIDYASDMGLEVKLLCLNKSPINNILLEEYCETNYPFESAVKFISDKDYLRCNINNEHSAIFKKNDHIVKVLACNEYDPLKYFTIYKSIRVYFDAHLAVTGAFDKYWRPLLLKNPSHSIRTMLEDLDKSLIDKPLIQAKK